MRTKRFTAIALAVTITTFAFNVSWAATPRTFFAVLLGGNEVSDEGVANVGAPNGRGSATILVDSDRSTVCFAITVTGIATPTAAHIHHEVAGRNGSIVVTLTQPSAGSPGSTSGCVTGVKKSLLQTIKNLPSNFYVNVHTSDFPGGAIRGQLF